jgi:hypothetical protein
MNEEISLLPVIITLVFAIVIIAIAAKIDQYRERAGLPEFIPPKYSTSLMDFASWRQYRSDHERAIEDAYSD